MSNKNFSLISRTRQEIDRLLLTHDATDETFQLHDYLEVEYVDCLSGTGLFPDEDLLFDTMRVITRLQAIPVESQQQDLAVLQYRWKLLAEELPKPAPTPQPKPQVITSLAKREGDKAETYKKIGNPKNTLIAAIVLFAIGVVFAPTIFWSLAIICIVVAAIEALANHNSKREFEKNN